MIYRHVYQADNSDAYHEIEIDTYNIRFGGEGSNRWWNRGCIRRTDYTGCVGANVLFVPADTIAMEAEPISRIESFIFDRLLLLLVLNRR